MIEYDINPSVNGKEDFLSHEVVDVLRRIPGDLKDAVDRIGFELGKPLIYVVTEACRSLKLALFEGCVIGIGTTEEFTKTSLGEGDIETG
jgi:hypothetical protein